MLPVVPFSVTPPCFSFRLGSSSHKRRTALIRIREATRYKIVLAFRSNSFGASVVSDVVVDEDELSVLFLNIRPISFILDAIFSLLRSSSSPSVVIEVASDAKESP